MWPNQTMMDVVIHERERERAIREREYLHRSELASIKNENGVLGRALTAGRNAFRRVWSPPQLRPDRAESGSPNVEVPT
jgi:hypothetical protein